MAVAEGALKRRVYEVLEDGGSGDPAARAFDRFIVTLILINVTTIVLETVPSLRATWGGWFRGVELVTVAIFTVEYGLRLWVADIHPPLRPLGSLRARLTYAVQPVAIIDLLAILPTVVGIVFDIWDVNVLAIFRLLRFLKLARYSPGMRSLAAALASERRALLACLVILGGLVVTAASIMHVVEGQAQPEKFGSIPIAMYWAVTTLTTVGYGDFTPITPLGRMVAGLTMVFGLAMFALPVGIIATAFAREIHQRDFVVTWGMVARVPLFAELSAGEIADVTKLLRSQVVETGTPIVFRGDPAHSMYFIASGEVAIEFEEGRVVLSEGQFFGEIAVLRRARRSADVVALSRAQLLVLDAEDLRLLIARDAEIGRRIRHAAAERLAKENVTPDGDLAETEIAGASPLDMPPRRRSV